MIGPAGDRGRRQLARARQHEALLARVATQLALPALLAAGASTVFTRRTSPTDIARELLALVHV